MYLQFPYLRFPVLAFSAPPIRHLVSTIIMIFAKLYQPEKSEPKRREDFSVSWPYAYFLNGPNAAASIGKKVKSSPYSITERMVPELIPVLGSQPAGDVSHKPGGRLPLLSARPAVTLATLKRAATNFAPWLWA